MELYPVTTMSTLHLIGTAVNTELISLVTILASCHAKHGDVKKKKNTEGKESKQRDADFNVGDKYFR